MKPFRAALAFLALLPSFVCIAQKPPDPIRIDASAPAATPEQGYLHMGGVSSTGHRLEVNSQYLVYDGKPWLPVMGEFHYSRYPEKYWEEEILKMKAGGVQIISTYVFWIHHEEIEGKFDWSGQRDLHRFVALCAQHGIFVYLRIGPWDHGEARNGGFPDWLLNKKIPLRRNDPEYLRYVSRWYSEIGHQIQGQLWKDGGPVIGVQIENEYGETGPGAGAEHLAKLRQIAIDAGINPPLFSVTGWPGHDYPVHDVIPVVGGYPDDFWTGLKTDAPPNPVYLFHSDRTLGDLGAMAVGDPNKKIDMAHYPQFAAEEGGGMQGSYHRRPLIQPEDIAALALTGIGSGVNLYGYYMFQGGANPIGKLSTLQESQATGYPNDLPVINYDYQAPIGQYGQERESFRKIKLLHYFLADFGEQLAPMPLRLPMLQPKDAADTSVPRVALRARDNSGFLFINNYVRKLRMPERKHFQVSVHFASGDMLLPPRPIDVPADCAFLWPVNLDLGSATLQYSTAQLIARVGSPGALNSNSRTNSGLTTYFFFAIPGVRPEFAFHADAATKVSATSGTVSTVPGTILVQGLVPGGDTVVTVSGQGPSVRIVLLSEAEAENFWILRKDAAHAGSEVALLSPADVFASGEQVHLRSSDPANERASLFSAARSDRRSTNVELWKPYEFHLEPRIVPVTFRKEKAAGPSSPPRMGPYVDFRHRAVPIAPRDTDFTRAAQWTIEVPSQPMHGISDLYLRIDYAGDVARLVDRGTLLDDDFYDGQTWEIGLKRFLPRLFDCPLELSILPLRRDAPVYLDSEAWKKLTAGSEAADVRSVSVVPEYEVTLDLPDW